MSLIVLLGDEFTLLDRVARGGAEGVVAASWESKAARTLVGYRLVRQSGDHLVLTLIGQQFVESGASPKSLMLECLSTTCG